MELRSPLSKALGLGSAKHGVHHWWVQRLTAVALVPLTLWLGIVVAKFPGVRYEDAVQWLGQPWNSALLVAFLVATFYHATLGVQVIIEDYVHTPWLKTATLLGVKLILMFLALASLVATLRIAITG